MTVEEIIEYIDQTRQEYLRLKEALEKHGKQDSAAYNRVCAEACQGILNRIRAPRGQAVPLTSKFEGVSVITTGWIDDRTQSKEEIQLGDLQHWIDGTGTRVYARSGRVRLEATFMAPRIVSNYRVWDGETIYYNGFDAAGAVDAYNRLVRDDRDGKE